MSTDLLTRLLQRLDEPAARFHTYDRYYGGQAPLSFLSPEAKKSLGNRLDHLNINIPRLVVDSIAERLRITGYTGADIWADWLSNDLDQQSTLLHREALIHGQAYVIVWADDLGRVKVTVESARQVATIHDPGTREVVAGIKRWETDTTTEAVVYQPDTITRYSADSKGAAAGFHVSGILDNPLGWVPVVRFRNTTRLLGNGRSEMDDVLSLSDALTKITTDMLVASEYGARPRRWATGLELDEQPVLDDQGSETGDVEAVNPIDESDRMMINEAPEGKFGQLAGSDLAGYTEAIGQLMRQISAVTGLPYHQLGIGGDNPTSADAIRASEAALTAKAEARQAIFGRQWEQVGRLMHAVSTGTSPDKINMSVTWADPATRSTAQEADAITKLFSVGLLPASAALRRLGYSDRDIDTIRTERRADTLAQVDLGQILA